MLIVQPDEPYQVPARSLLLEARAKFRVYAGSTLVLQARQALPGAGMLVTF